MTFVIIVGGVMLMAFGLWWYLVGYATGVKHTEQRWSEAVARKADRTGGQG